MSLIPTQGCKKQIKAFALMHHFHAPTFTVVASICFHSSLISSGGIAFCE